MPSFALSGGNERWSISNQLQPALRVITATCPYHADEDEDEDEDKDGFDDVVDYGKANGGEDQDDDDDQDDDENV